MKNFWRVLAMLCAVLVNSMAQSSQADRLFKMALPGRNGQLRWHAEGFKVTEFSAKPNGNEIGIRSENESKRIRSLGFLFLYSDQAPLTNAKCRDSIMSAEQKDNHSIRIESTSDMAQSDGQKTAIVAYTYQERKKTWYVLRGFVASDDICGDLAFFSEAPIRDDVDLHKIFGSLTFDKEYVPQFDDSFLYASILYQHHAFKAAGPVYEKALTRLEDDGSPKAKTMRRVSTDQAGMSYGIAGDIAKSRALFIAAIAQDPDYPLYYYNLACADAEEGKLDDAKKHLQEAFSRKANVIPSEKMPDPTQDDSFTRYRNNKQFWSFLESLH